LSPHPIAYRSSFREQWADEHAPTRCQFECCLPVPCVSLSGGIRQRTRSAPPTACASARARLCRHRLGNDVGGRDYCFEVNSARAIQIRPALVDMKNCGSSPAIPLPNHGASEIEDVVTAMPSNAYTIDLLSHRSAGDAVRQRSRGWSGNDELMKKENDDAKKQRWSSTPPYP
jgi:hypothetical protein